PEREHAALYEEAKRKSPSLGASGGSALKRAKRLAGFNADHPLAGVVVAAAALDAGDLDAARQAVADATEAEAADSVWAVDFYEVVRRLAEAEDDAAGARDALAAAAAAPPPAPWACGECGLLSQHWTPICARCGALEAAAQDVGDPNDAAETAETDGAAALPAPSPAS
ncbi:MAG: hypothetical protein AAF684_00555, partial [Pseudomonadota bacterium]